MNRTVCFDCGTSQVKYLILDENPSSGFINNHIEENIEKIISKKYENVVFTGSNAEKYAQNYDAIIVNELQAIGHTIKYMGYDNGLVVNIGTGTSYVKYDNGNVQHLIGTGLGGGTFLGLSQRLLHTSDLEKVEDIAITGDLGHINTQIKDITYQSLSWFKGDLTVANFSKSGAEKNDIAIGIHSLIAEPIMSILKSLCIGNFFELIVFSGGMIKNSLFRNFLLKYSDIFNLNTTFFANPDFATCYGAILLSEKENIYCL